MTRLNRETGAKKIRNRRHWGIDQYLHVCDNIDFLWLHLCICLSADFCFILLSVCNNSISLIMIPTAKVRTQTKVTELTGRQLHLTFKHRFFSCSSTNVQLWVVQLWSNSTEGSLGASLLQTHDQAAVCDAFKACNGLRM